LQNSVPKFMRVPCVKNQFNILLWIFFFDTPQRRKGLFSSALAFGQFWWGSAGPNSKYPSHDFYFKNQASAIHFYMARADIQLAWTCVAAPNVNGNEKISNVCCVNLRFQNGTILMISGWKLLSEYTVW